MSAFLDGLQGLRRGAQLDAESAEGLLAEVLDGKVEPPHISEFLETLADRGETAEELTGFARAMRARAIHVEVPDGAVDTCGTGGSGKPTVNTSTLAAFTLAAAGVPVAKHGNRASSGLCGSADVLDRAGVRVEVEPDECAALLERTGLVFLHAPLFHPSMKYVGPVRRELGIRTVFNFLGPLCNPAGVRRQLLGVSSREHAPRMAAALAELGVDRAVVVAGDDGLDELSLAGPTQIWVVDGGEVRQAEVTPEAVGLRSRPFEEFAGGDPDRNLSIFQELIDGATGAHGDHLTLNVAAGLLVGGKVDDLIDGVELAREVRQSGRVRAVFEDYREAARS
jgi:anthranilate phosphoribosyltransferase